MNGLILGDGANQPDKEIDMTPQHRTTSTTKATAPPASTMKHSDSCSAMIKDDGSGGVTASAHTVENSAQSVVGTP